MSNKNRPDLFQHVVNSLRYGAAAEELSEALAECVDRARDAGKAATLTLTIKIKPKGNSGQYFIEDDIKTKVPALMKEETIMFGTPDGNLTREDPRQQKLPLRVAGDEKAPVKDVASEPAAVKTVN